MLQEHVELAKLIEGAFNRRDLRVLEERLDPDFQFDSVLARSEGRVYRGLEGMAQYFRDLDDAWHEFRIELEGLREAGDQVVILWRVRARSRTGVLLEQVTAQVWAWRDGMLWRIEAFIDPREALEAVGLRE